jgi:hypothetical protein
MAVITLIALITTKIIKVYTLSRVIIALLAFFIVAAS